MMDLAKIIQDKVKKKEVVLGYEKVIKSIKTEHPSMIVMANNIPKERRNIVEHNAKLAKIEVKNFPGSNVDLGVICGKPFNVSILAIEGSQK